MSKNVILAVVIGLVIGIGGTIGVSAMMNKDDNATTQQSATDHSTMSMADMNKQLEGLSGDAYDKAFIEMMIAHHQGAIDMAKLSASRAKHDEIKQLSADIIAAQEKEISEMYQWQSMWGYGPAENNSMPGMNH